MAVGVRRMGTEGVFQGDILAGQEERHRKREWTRTQNLLAAVLEEAIGSATGHIPMSDAGPGNCVETRRARQRAIRANARRWIASDREDAPLWFTFVRVCEVLGLDPGYIRQRVAGQTRAAARSYRRNRAATGLGAGPLVPVPLGGAG